MGGTTVRDVLESYFARHPLVRTYVFDEQASLRRHVVVFINDQQASDRKQLSDPVPEDAEVHVMHTTGSLFVTENAGDQWSCLSNHLPPIYAVRFAAPP